MANGEQCVCRHRRGSCDQTCAQDLLRTPLYMAALALEGQRCLVIGGGTVALEKIDGLLACGARVTVLAPDARPEIVQLALEGSVRWECREYETADLEGCLLAIAATGRTEVNIRVHDDAQRRSMLINVVDVPPLCNFILPAVARSGPIALAISTAGASPALAKRMKREAAERFGEPYAILALILADVRGWAKRELPTYADRREFFESIVNGHPDPIELIRAGDLDGVRELVQAAQQSRTTAQWTS